MLGQHQRSAPVVSSPAPGGCAGPATMGFARSSNGFVVPVANEEFQQHEDTKYYDALNKSGGSGGAGAGGDKSYYYGGGDPNGESRRRSRSRGSSSRQQTFEGGGGLFRPPGKRERTRERERKRNVATAVPICIVGKPSQICLRSPFWPRPIVC